MNDETEPACCPSCDVAYTDHLGLNGTCAQLQEARTEVERLRALALQLMDGPPTEPGAYLFVVQGITGAFEVRQISGRLYVTTADGPAPLSDMLHDTLAWLARIPVQALEVSDG